MLYGMILIKMKKHKSKGICCGDTLHAPSRMFPFTIMFFRTALFLIALCALTHRSSLCSTIWHLHLQEVSAKVPFVSQESPIQSNSEPRWITAFDVHHNIKDGRGRVIQCCTSTWGWNFSLGNAVLCCIHGFPPHLYLMYNIPTYLAYFHPLPLNLVPVALSQIFLSFHSECWLFWLSLCPLSQPLLLCPQPSPCAARRSLLAQRCPQLVLFVAQPFHPMNHSSSHQSDHRISVNCELSAGWLQLYANETFSTEGCSKTLPHKAYFTLTHIYCATHTDHLSAASNHISSGKRVNSFLSILLYLTHGQLLKYFLMFIVLNTAMIL